MYLPLNDRLNNININISIIKSTHFFINIKYESNNIVGLVLISQKYIIHKYHTMK